VGVWQVLARRGRAGSLCHVAGYAASSRLQGAVPRFAGASPGHGGAAVPLGPESIPIVGEQPIFDQVELVGRPLDEAIGDWLAAIGESWSQLTFYLFDSDSWR
jgi:hypothetical protein